LLRYYTLVDFAVSERDSRVAVGIRLAFEEAERLTTFVDSAAPTQSSAPTRRDS